MELGDRNMDRPTDNPVTGQAAEPTSRQSSVQTRARHHRPRFNPLAKALGRKKRDPAPPDMSSSPVVDLNGLSPVTAHARRGHLPTIPEPVAVSARGGRHEATPSVQMTTVRYASDPSAPHQPGAGTGGQDGVSSRDEADEEGGTSRSSKPFLLCLPRPKSRHVRSQAVSCFISGIFALVLLAIYVGLTQSNTLRQGELSILIALVILAAGAFFFFSAVRLWLAVFRPERENRRRAHIMGPSRYVVPPKPIPVVLARDEEAAGIESQAVKSRPPAYGLWRESVRVDPNRLFWQRNQSPAMPELRTGPRPPSYASEDGITYVVEARPRSTLPPRGTVHQADVLESMHRPANHVGGPHQQQRHH
ncbi:hypothetical protein HRG_000060 [Hirsutella rhossiliensis]|uniref:Uncharacterized protein n=1 Tax=Hirsutella rhossiliensis TaxID=111463 RepID=A0A9P8N337_9HYPO|nr:uncharacterized protein HRG_00060 [Hirsutella rhossiliensis]KAH0967418.1 hypothetical protein HRG_00060 [Hirsutella rhossiliensis]